VTAVQYDLPLIWAGFVAFFVIMYVVMDGFDLGIGILFPFARSDTDRDLMMNSVAPIWDGNETWLVLGGTSLLAAFPIAYSVLLPAFYLPLFVMLLALIFRGVSFEFRFKSIENRHWWDRAFTFGSMAATFAQGVVLGSFILGVKVTDRQYSGGAFSWFTPFALFCGLAEAGTHPENRGVVWRDGIPFACALGLFFLAYTGLGISMWPMIVPPHITIWDAASPRSSQLFMLVGAAVLIPVILAYTAYVYWLFRGKIKAGQGYH